MNRIEQLKVTTHVGRDILQSADLFRHPERVVWEYVVNGLEYTDPGTSPRVAVSINQIHGELRLQTTDVAWIELGSFNSSLCTRKIQIEPLGNPGAVSLARGSQLPLRLLTY